jgi:hypothetical protein
VLSIMLLVVVILTFFACSTIFFVLPTMAGRRGQIEGGESAQDIAVLKESFEELTARVALLEEGMEFYSQLRGSEDKPQIEPGPDQIEPGSEA